MQRDLSDLSDLSETHLKIFSIKICFLHQIVNVLFLLLVILVIGIIWHIPSLPYFPDGKATQLVRNVLIKTFDSKGDWTSVNYPCPTYATDSFMYMALFPFTISQSQSVGQSVRHIFNFRWKVTMCCSSQQRAVFSC